MRLGLSVIIQIKQTEVFLPKLGLVSCGFDIKKQIECTLFYLLRLCVVIFVTIIGKY